MSTIGPHTATGGPTPSREKHIELLAAIKDTRRVEIHLEDLLSRIVAGENNSEEKQVPTDPTASLRDVLDGAPSEIRTINDRMHAVIDEIKSQLF